MYSQNIGEMITCMHIMNKTDSVEQRDFEIVFGNSLGSIYHGTFYLVPRGILQNKD